MDNIIYLDDYINLYNTKLDKLIVYKPYKDTLKYGHIINRDKFIKIMNKILKEYHLNKNIFNSNITILINQSYSNIDKYLLKEVLEELNYHQIKFINIVNYLNIKKDELYIEYNNSYSVFNYLDIYGNVSYHIYNNDYIIDKLVDKIINIINKKKVIIYGKGYERLVNLINNKIDNYYYYEDSYNIIIKKYLESSVK